MGWGRTLLLGNLGTQMNVDDASRDIDALHEQLRTERGENLSQNELIRRLRVENDELKLYLAALVRLLLAKGAFTRDEFAQLVDAIDREDGAGDGQYRGRVV